MFEVYRNCACTVTKTAIISVSAALVFTIILSVYMTVKYRKQIRKQSIELETAKSTLMQSNSYLEQAQKVSKQALEVADAANRSKSTFLSNMKHDICTPLNEIIRFSSLLSEMTDDPEKVREYSEKIAVSGNELLELMNDILAMCRIENGTEMLTLSDESLNGIISGIDYMIRPLINEKNHKFEIVTKNIVHDDIILDKIKLNQILMNLLSNAVKYTPDNGQIIFEISELSSTYNTAQYRFAVSDNGCGMSRDFMSKVFEPFCREKDSSTNSIHGTGLGLAITKSLVDLMGGTIRAESIKNAGSEFSVELQFRLGEKKDHTRFWADKGISSIIVLDSDEKCSKDIAAAMENTGVAVDCAVSTEEIIRSFKENGAYQIVLLDLKMSVMHGTETVKTLRSYLPAGTLFILLTSPDRVFADETLYDTAIDGVLPKPFVKAAFIKKIEEIIPVQ